MELAAALRWIALLGMHEEFRHHLTVTLPDHRCLINPKGIAFHQITASGLLQPVFVLRRGVVSATTLLSDRFPSSLRRVRHNRETMSLVIVATLLLTEAAHSLNRHADHAARLQLTGPAGSAICTSRLVASASVPTSPGRPRPRHLQVKFRHRHPLTLCGAAISKIGELHGLGAFHESRNIRRILGNVP